MMKLNFSIETEDLYGEDGLDFESLLSDSLKRSIIKDAKNQVASEEFKRFSELVNNTIIADIKLRMQNFLSEEISITEKWGKPTFVGSIEDLIKLRFDDVILRPVNSSGETLQGCTSSSKTWIEWSIEKQLKDMMKTHIKNATDTLSQNLKEFIGKKMIEIKDNLLNKELGEVFASILQKVE